MTDHIEQAARQAELEARYEADGRGDRSHPHHATYTGLVAGFNDDTQETTDGD
jgi:hypothetical protein